MQDFHTWEIILSTIGSSAIALKIVEYLFSRLSQKADGKRSERLELLEERRKIQNDLRKDLERKEQELVRLREENWRLRDQLQTLYFQIEDSDP